MATNPIGAGTGGYAVYIAKETNWGTAPTARSSYVMMPAEPASLVDTVEAVVDDLARGQNIIGFNRMEGVHRTELSLSSIAYPDQIGYFLLSILGRDTMTGTGPYTHTFDVIADKASDATPSLAVAVVDDVLTAGNELVHEGCKVTNLAFRFTVAEGFLTFEAGLSGRGARKGSEVGLTGSFPAEPANNNPWRGWEALVTGPAALQGKVTEAELTIAREADIVFATATSASPNNKYADAVIHGRVGITGSITAVFDNVSALDLYRNFSTSQMSIIFDNGQTGANLRRITFDLKKVTFGEDPAEIDRSGNYMRITYSFRGLYDAATATGIQVVLVNNRSTAY